LSKGLASVKTLTAKQIADKFKLPLSVVAKKIAAGVKVEKEHTKSLRQANEIARDHLGERPDYYDKLDKMEKTKVVKEETTTTGIGGLGFRTGTPAIDDDNGYVSTNALAYDPLNGARLDLMKKIHSKLHVSLGFNEFNPTSKDHSNRVVKEAKHPLQANYDKYRKGELNELGEYDNKGGMSGYEGTSGPIRAVRKNEMTPIKERSTGKMPADMSGAAERGIYQEATYKGKEVALNKPMKGDVKKSKVFVDPDGDGKAQKVNFGDKKLSIKKDQPSRKKSYCARSGGISGKKDVTSANYWSRKAWNCEEETVNEISAELVGKVSNARWRRGEAPSKTLTRAINKKFVESGKKKEEKKEVKEYWMPFLSPHHKHSARLNKEKSNKPDIILDPGGKKGKTIYENLKEETKMDNKELINEALDCILEDNLPEMKDNLMKALQEKAMEKLEERKKEIAANYFAQ